MSLTRRFKNKKIGAELKWPPAPRAFLAVAGGGKGMIFHRSPVTSVLVRLLIAGRGLLQTPWRRALSFGLISLALGSGIALTEAGGCARCGGEAANPAAAVAPEVFVPRMEPNFREDKPRRHASRTSLRRVDAAGGDYTVCVRECDGGFFPVTYFGAKSRADSLEQVCQALCPNARVALYSFPFGGTIDEAVSSSGEPYDSLPNAHKFEHARDASCSCRPPGQSWAEALAAAEARYGHGAHDILVTEEQSARMSRPAADSERTASGISKSAAAGLEAPLVLDMNGVDTRLGAATAKMSRAASGIEDEDSDAPLRFGLQQGKVIEENGPGGSQRRVRVLPVTF